MICSQSSTISKGLYILFSSLFISVNLCSSLFNFHMKKVRVCVPWSVIRWRWSIWVAKEGDGRSKNREWTEPGKPALSIKWCRKKCQEPSPNIERSNPTSESKFLCPISLPDSSPWPSSAKGLLQVDQHRFPIRILGQFPITLLRLQITAWHTWYGPSFSPPKASERMPIDFPSLILVKPLETQHHKVTKYIKIKIIQYNSSLEMCHQPRMVWTQDIARAPSTC